MRHFDGTLLMAHLDVSFVCDVLIRRFDGTNNEKL